MKVRRLQRKDDEGQWYDDAYAVEESSGQVVFHYNLTWEKIGSYPCMALSCHTPL
jgi:hypothetical protein